MEKRLLLFFGVTFLIVSLWWRIFPPPAPVAVDDAAAPPPAAVTASGPPEDVTAETPKVKESEAREERYDAEVLAQGSVPSDAVQASTERELVVETSLYRMVLSNRGARILGIELKHFGDEGGQPYEMVTQSAAEALNVRPLDVRLEDARDTTTLADALFVTEAPEKISIDGGKSREAVFVWSDGRGLEIEKKLSFTDGTYRVAVSVSAKDRGEEIEKAVVYGAGIGNEFAESRYVGVEKGVVVARGEVELFKASDLEEGGGGGVSVSGVGVASHYFVGMMVPADEGNYGARLEKHVIALDDAEHPERTVITALLEAPRSPAVFTLYTGPKKLERLEALAPGMGQIIEFGSWMRYPALLLRTGLMKLDGVVGNYGWAIILLTVGINVVLLPLKHYSFVSMRRMQKLSPQIQKIRDRYKKVKPTDPRYQHMNQEIMGLYKEHNVSPISGCLPMLLMIPFFFAFYRLLMASVELRQAPFIFWISDLSRYDPLFVLPVLMGGTQLAIQRMTPQTSADPVQTKIMSFMPIMFTFILAWAPSGLVLYWFSNNLVSMTQQMVTNRFLKEREETAAAVKAVKKRKGKKSGKGQPA